MLWVSFLHNVLFEKAKTISYIKGSEGLSNKAPLITFINVLLFMPVNQMMLSWKLLFCTNLHDGNQNKNNCIFKATVHM